MLTLLLLLVASNVYMLVQQRRGVLVPRIFGWAYLHVITGSMEPAIPTDSLILIHAQDSYAVGDIVTYVREGGTRSITHRIVEIWEDTVVTQGDANNATDERMQADTIMGKVLVIVPGMGKAILWLRSMPGILLISALGVALLFLPELRRLLRRKKEMPPAQSEDEIEIEYDIPDVEIEHDLED